MANAKSKKSAVFPREWEERIKTVEQLNPTRADCRRIAVFDLDNTLLIHDVGEAVFALLRSRSLEGGLADIHDPLPLSWTRYVQLRESGQRREAYCRVVTAMAGLTAETISGITREVMNWPIDKLEVEGAHVPVPRPDPVMLALLRRLKQANFELFVISASNHVTVRTISTEFLGIRPDHAWGIRSLATIENRDKPVFTTELSSPIPYGKGKVELFQQKLKDCLPLVSGGDSISDIPLLNLTPREGAVFWAGNPGLLNRRPSPFRYPANVLVHGPVRP
ncbi:MAG: haloacid dehalogenase-like hydrolase [Candidatus Aminicenantes bacterium]|nr:haloacid dehalogenase-like hydrolase [Candidatus Aminicenantes bacterium]